MSSNVDRKSYINVRLPSYHPQLLAGLETLLELGLISDSQVKQILDVRSFLTRKFN